MTAPRSPWVPDEPDTPNVVPPPAPVTVPDPERAEQDLLIDRPDLAPGAATLIIASHVIPAHLADRPRRPARPEATPPDKRRRGG